MVTFLSKCSIITHNYDLSSGGDLVVTSGYCFITSILCLVFTTLVIFGLFYILLCDHNSRGKTVIVLALLNS